MPAARLHLHLFGLFRLLRDDQPVAGFHQARLQHLLAYLVLHRAAPTYCRQFAFLCRPDSTDRQALRSRRCDKARPTICSGPTSGRQGAKNQRE